MNNTEINKHVDYHVSLVRAILANIEGLNEKDQKQLTLLFTGKGFAALSMFYLLRLKSFLKTTADFDLEIPEDLQEYTKNYKEQFTLSANGKLLYEGEDFETIKKAATNANTQDKV